MESKPGFKFIIVLSLSFWMVFSASDCFSQFTTTEHNIEYAPHKSSYGINVSGSATGSGLGVNLNPSFFFRYKRNVLAVGPNVQRDHMHLSGLQGYFEHDFNINIKQFMLYYQMNVLYHRSANLGPASSDQYRNIYGSAEGVRLNTFEHYMGLGLRKNLSDHINFDTGLGIGAYHMLNANEIPNRVPFKADNDLSLMFKIGLTYDFKN